MSGSEGASPPTVGYVIHGGGGRHPGSAHVRVLNRVAVAVASGGIRARQVTEFTADQLTELDALLIQRDAVPPDAVRQIVRARRRAPIRLVMDLDDDLVSPIARERLVRQGYAKDRLDSVTRLLDEVDLAIVSTPQIQESLEFRDVVARVVDNDLNIGLWPAGGTWRPPRATGLRLLFAGTASHREDLELLEPVMRGLSSIASLDVVGVSDRSTSWYRAIPVGDEHANYPDYAQLLSSMARRWDVGLAPLQEHSFNWAKSDLKLLEYGALGLPAVASPSPAYRRTAPKLGGVIAADTEEWVDTIRAMAKSRRMRLRRGAQARREVLASRTIDSPGQNRWLGLVLGSGAEGDGEK